MQIINHKSKKTISVRTRCSIEDLPRFLHESFRELSRYSWRRLILPAGKPFVIYHSEDSETIDVEAGIPVFFQGRGTARVKPGEIPAGTYAAVRHKGPYSSMPAAYKFLEEYIQENGYKRIGLSYEVFRTNPGLTPPAMLKTDIFFLVQKTDKEG